MQFSLSLLLGTDSGEPFHVGGQSVRRFHPGPQFRARRSKEGYRDTKDPSVRRAADRTPPWGPPSRWSHAACSATRLGIEAGETVSENRSAMPSRSEIAIAAAAVVSMLAGVVAAEARGEAVCIDALGDAARNSAYV